MALYGSGIPMHCALLGLLKNNKEVCGKIRSKMTAFQSCAEKDEENPQLVISKHDACVCGHDTFENYLHVLNKYKIMMHLSRHVNLLKRSVFF